MIQIHNLYGLSANTISLFGPLPLCGRWLMFRVIMGEVKRGRLRGINEITWDDSPYGRVMSKVFTTHGEVIPETSTAKDLFQLEILDRIADVELCSRFVWLYMQVCEDHRNGYGRHGEKRPFDPSGDDCHEKTWDGVEFLLNHLGTPTDEIPEDPVPTWVTDRLKAPWIELSARQWIAFTKAHTSNPEILQDCLAQFEVVTDARRHRLTRYKGYYTDYNNPDIPVDDLHWDHRWLPHEDTSE